MSKISMVTGKNCTMRAKLLSISLKFCLITLKHVQDLNEIFFEELNKKVDSNFIFFGKKWNTIEYSKVISRTCFFNWNARIELDIEFSHAKSCSIKFLFIRIRPISSIACFSEVFPLRFNLASPAARTTSNIFFVNMPPGKNCYGIFYVATRIYYPTTKRYNKITRKCTGK